MTPDQVREAVEQRFTTQWAARTVFTFEGEKFKIPGPDANWVRLSVRHFGGGQETLGSSGNRIYRRVGQIIGQVFSPLIKGMRTGSSYAQDFRGIFEGTKFSTIDCLNGRILEIGPDASHYQHNVEIDLYYDEKK